MCKRAMKAVMVFFMSAILKYNFFLLWRVFVLSTLGNLKQIRFYRSRFLPSIFYFSIYNDDIFPTKEFDPNSSIYIDKKFIEEKIIIGN